MLSINRSGYYKWKKRQNSVNRYEKYRNILTPYVKNIHEKHRAYGYHAIASALREKTELEFSDNLIHKICKFNCLQSKSNHYKWKRTGSEHTVFNNKIKGNWNAIHPLGIVVSDMTEIKYRNRRVEWTYILDTFNNSIIASSYSFFRGDPKPYYDCLEQLKQIIKNEEIAAPIYYHTDQGSVYSSKAYNLGISNYNIIRSMSRAGTPTDNPIIESLNGWIKSEISLDYKPSSYNSIDDFFRDYIRHFNYERPSHKLKYKTPAQYTIEQGFHCLF